MTPARPRPGRREPAGQELARRVTAAGFRIRQVRAFGGDQRHRSWRMSVHGGRVLWAKAERQQSAVAGVRREAAALARLSGLALVPELVAHGQLSDGVPYLVTAGVRGHLLTGASLRRAGTVAAAADALRAFGALARTGAGPSYPGRDVFATRPDLAALLQPALGWLSAAGLLVPALRAGLADGFPAEPPRLVHGSAHPGNVLVTPAGTAVFIDLEAVRVGAASFDVAAMAGGLLADGDRTAAQAWLAGAVPALGLPIRNVCGFLALRAWHRSQARALTAAEREALPALLSGLPQS